MSTHRTAMRNVVTATLVALVVAVPAMAGSGKQHHRPSTREPMKNYGVVWVHKLTRSGMPRADTGWDWLREQGVKSVVTLREDEDVDYAKHGFTNVLRIPLNESSFPTEAQARQFLAFIQDPENQPVHVHCAAGKDRTGLMVALARYAVDGWPLDKALAEARTYRGGESLDHDRVAWLKDWAGKHPPGNARLEGLPSPARSGGVPHP